MPPETDTTTEPATEAPEQPPPVPEPTPEPTPDEAFALRMKSDHRGRLASMIDLILRAASPAELEEICEVVRPHATKMAAKL